MTYNRLKKFHRTLDESVARDVNTTSLEVTVTSLKPGIAYLFSVTAFGVSGSSFESGQIEIRTSLLFYSCCISYVVKQLFKIYHAAFYI